MKQRKKTFLPFFLHVLSFRDTISGCNSPSKVGYIFGTPTATTYGGTVRVISCATGYTGSPAVTELTCQDTGKWSDVTGCTISGKLAMIDYVGFL